MGATPARTSKFGSSNSSALAPAASQFLEEASGANHSRWEFNNRKTLLYALVGNDFGADPESRLDEIREYKKNEAKFLIQSLNLKPNGRVVDLAAVLHLSRVPSRRWSSVCAAWTSAANSWIAPGGSRRIHQISNCTRWISQTLTFLAGKE